ncbi:YdcF family protein [Methylocystis sp. H62]|uniref:YdcF family protein n=1 Tax=Methylocystis sp. H62 TaxID=2785789 RepID=UPI0018C2BBAC|nr:YdcF family protein [Methylocystis sp. H62]MBG0791940.1 YdcF family protein [Methylocystis sp. H62]
MPFNYAIIKFLASPTVLLLFIGALGAALTFTRNYSRWGRWIASATFLLLALAAFGPLGHLLAAPLESRFPPPPDDMILPDGIIVLGGAAGENQSGLRGHLTFNESAERLTMPIELKRQFPNARLVFTSHARETMQVRDFWKRVGLDQGDVLYEENSNDTYENAVFTKDLVKPKPGERWLLVTSATHMPRSVGVFRHIGFPVIAYPVDYRTSREAGKWHRPASPSKGLGLVETAAHEWIGLIAYRLSGKTDTLVPSP